MIKANAKYEVTMKRVITRNDGRKEHLFDVDENTAHVEKIEYPDGTVWEAPLVKRAYWQAQKVAAELRGES